MTRSRCTLASVIVLLKENLKVTTPPSMMAEVHAVMAAPRFAADNDGYAVTSVIARECRRNIDSVKRALSQGERLGLFTARSHPSMISPATRKPLTEYRAIPSS